MAAVRFNISKLSDALEHYREREGEITRMGRKEEGLEEAIVTMSR